MIAANLLTFDIEGFVESSHDSMTVPGRYVSESREAEEIEVNTLEILEVLAGFGQHATFFILGRIARDMPALVRRIAEAGHEIACHSFNHRRLFYFSRPEVRRFLGDAKRALEDASGQQVCGFRAPDFSITQVNLWVFDVLRELSFEYDSSVYPTGLHDVYGIAGFSRKPFRLSNGLIELPMSTVTIFGQNIPFGGGGYLRLYPLAVTRTLIRRANRKGEPCVVYFHPFEIGKIVPRIEELSPIRKLRTYGGVRTAKDKLRALLREFRFIRAIDFLKDNFLSEASL